MTLIGGLYPSDTLYPSDSLFPSSPVFVPGPDPETVLSGEDVYDDLLVAIEPIDV